MTNDFFFEAEIKIFIPRYVEYIRKDISSYIQNEGYKYPVVADFRKEFDIDAPGFAPMLKVAFSKTKNLVDSGRYLPGRMLVQYAKDDPEFVRSSLRELFEHSSEVGRRTDAFIEAMNARFKEEGVQSYFDRRFISFILSALFPEKYIYVKPLEIKKFAKLIKYSLKGGKTQGERFTSDLEFSEIIRSVLARSPELITVHRDVVADCQYRDQSLSWGTLDFIFNSVRRLSDVKVKEEYTEAVNRRESFRNQMVEQYEDAVFTDEFYNQVQEASKENILNAARAYTSSGDGYKLVDGVTKVRKDNGMQKLRIKRIENFTCQVCGMIIEYINAQGEKRRFVHADHIQDKAKGGNEEIGNIWVLCPNCHALKTYGVIVVDIKKKKVYKNGREISITDHHLGWNEK